MASNSNEVVPLGPVFKLYAIVATGGDGTISWDTPVTIEDTLDILPSGDSQDLETGTERSVRELAEVMISVSDNTDCQRDPAQLFGYLRDKVG